MGAQVRRPVPSLISKRRSGSCVRARRERAMPRKNDPIAHKRFTLSDHLQRTAHAAPYDPFERRRRESAAIRTPVTRRLKVYTQDPATPRLDIAFAEAAVPFEPLGPGPNGCVIRV